MFRLILLFTLITSDCHAQYQDIYNLKLPNEFVKKSSDLMIYSSPNPNYPERDQNNTQQVVWKHETIIKALENITIQETGAFLLYNGAWKKRVAFNKKQTKKYFNTNTLTLNKGDSIVFKENWRYDKYTSTGWNFWYVKATKPTGDTIYAYNILETKGAMADGTQVLLLKSKDSEVNWSGKASDSDYTLSGKINNS